jgi:hypothetical protein
VNPTNDPHDGATRSTEKRGFPSPTREKYGQIAEGRRSTTTISKLKSAMRPTKEIKNQRKVRTEKRRE